MRSWQGCLKCLLRQEILCHWTVRGVSTRSKVDLNKISLDWRILRQGRNGRKLWRVEVERPLLLKKKIAPTRKDT